jgi:hypothetical protein
MIASRSAKISLFIALELKELSLLIEFKSNETFFSPSLLTLPLEFGGSRFSWKKDIP